MDFNNSIPIYIQIMDIIKKGIVAGKPAAGERLMSVRDLSAEMGVNPNTTQKALFMLENEGLIYTDRTRGKMVTSDNEKILQVRQTLIQLKIDEFLRSMMDLGVEKEEAINFLSNGGL